MDNAQAVIIMTTFEGRKEARATIEQLFDDKLIACAQMGEVETLFEREGKLGVEPEVVALLKTTAEKAQQAAEELERIHPNDVPEVLTLGAEASVAYRHWLLAATGAIVPEAADVPPAEDAPTGAKEPVRRDRKGNPYRSAKYERKADRKASEKSKKKGRDAERKAKQKAAKK